MGLCRKLYRNLLAALVFLVTVYLGIALLDSSLEIAQVRVRQQRDEPISPEVEDTADKPPVLRDEILPKSPTRKLNKTMISIRGERHSGTGWLRTMITQNCPTVKFKINKTIDADGKYGWKHTFLEDDQAEKVADSDVVVVIFRDFRDWIQKMNAETYEKVPKNKLLMSEFLRSPWQPSNERHWADIFEMRNFKYRNWLELTDKYPDKFTFINYEDLYRDPEAFFKRLVEDYGVTCNQNFKKIDNYAKLNQVARVKKGPKRGQPVRFEAFVHERYTDEDWTYIVSKIDRELEYRLGYLRRHF